MNQLLKEQALLTFCPECEALLRFIVQPEIGDVVLCPDCTTTLEVQETFPLALDWHFQKPLREDEPFYAENWDEWEDETGKTYFSSWEWIDTKEPDKPDEWTQLLEQTTSDEKAPEVAAVWLENPTCL